MSRLTPSDILDNGGNYHGFSLRELMAMAEHYGFRRTDHHTGPHRVYRHREFHDVTFRLPHGSGEAQGIKAEEVAKACREVKRRNAERRNAVRTDPIPDWMWQARPPGEACEAENNLLEVNTYTVDENENFSPVCHYLVSWNPTGKGHDLIIECLDIPGLEKKLSFRNGSRERADTVKHAFTEFDTEVRLTLANRYHDYYKRCANLQKAYGFIFDEDHETSPPIVRISHPAYDIVYEMPAFGPDQYIDDAMLDTLDICKQRAEAQYQAAFARVTELEQQGWECGYNRAERMYMFAKGERVEKVPTYGALGLFCCPDIEADVTSEREVPLVVINGRNQLGAEPQRHRKADVVLPSSRVPD